MDYNFASFMNDSEIDITSATIEILNLPDITPNSVLYTDSASNVTGVVLTPSKIVGTDGSSLLQSLNTTSTTDCTLIMSGSNLYINTPQNINTNQAPIFASLLLIANPLGTSFIQFQTMAGQGNIRYTDGVGTRIDDGVTLGYINISTAITTNNNILDDGAGKLTASNIVDTGLLASMPVLSNGLKQLVSGNISLTSNVSGILPIANGGTNSSTTLTNGFLMVSSAGKIIEGTSATAPSFSGTVTVGELIDSGLIADRPVFSNSSKQLVSSPPISNGQLIIGRTGLSPLCNNLTGTTNQVVVTNGIGTITLSTPQSIGTASTVTFGNIINAGLK